MHVQHVVYSRTVCVFVLFFNFFNLFSARRPGGPAMMGPMGLFWQSALVFHNIMKLCMLIWANKDACLIQQSETLQIWSQVDRGIDKLALKGV